MEVFLVFIVIVSFATIGVLFALSSHYTAKRILARWCKRRNYTLEKKKWIFWDLFFWRYEITVTDKDHNLKNGKVRIGSLFFGLLTRKVRVTWY